MNDWREWRKCRRLELMGRRESVSDEDYLRWSGAISNLLKQGFPSLQKGIVGFCWPHRREYDPRPVMDFFEKHGAMLALPEVVGKQEPLRFRQWWREAPMKIGAYDIPVPDNTDSITIEALIIPMIGFDNRGFRLGYGSGYFDRTLAAMNRRPLVIGVAFEILRLDDLHPQPHDIPMDFIVTEAGIYRATPSGLRLISAAECAAENLSNAISSGKQQTDA